MGPSAPELPTLEEVAETLRQLHAEHEKQLQELRAQVSLLQSPTEATSTTVGAKSDQTEHGGFSGQATVVLDEDDDESLCEVQEPGKDAGKLPGMPDSPKAETAEASSERRESSHSGFTSSSGGSLKAGKASTWASKQYRAPGEDPAGGEAPNMENLRPELARHLQASLRVRKASIPGEGNFKLHPFFDAAQRAGLRRTSSEDMGMDVTNLANEGLELRDRDESQNLRTTRMTRIFAENNKDGNEEQPTWWIAHPGNRRNVVWDVFGAMFVLYDCFVIPLRVFNPPVTPVWVLVEWLGIIYWTINIPVTLTLGYVVDGEAIMNPYSIFMHYLKTWFVVDAMVLPFDWIFAIMDVEAETGTDGEVVKLLRALRLVRTARLIRLIKLKWILEAIDDAFESEMAGIWVKIFKMVLLLLAINHLIACVWFLLASTNPADDTWLVQEGFDTVNWDYQYATAFHWSITQFTPAGMEVQPHNMTERTFTIAVVVFALVGFSYVVGSITGSLAQLRSMSEHTVKEFWRLRLFLKRHKVPPPLALRIKRFVEFEFQRQQKMMPLETVGVLKLLSEQMMSELQAAINIPHMTVHPLFELLRDKSSLVMHRICNTALGHKQLAPGDILFMPGEQASCMYFLTTGRLWYRRPSVEPPGGVEIQDEPRGEWVEADEDWITEPGIWLAEWEHLGSATATRPSSVIKLRSENLYEVIKQCPPSFWRFLKEYATRFCNWLDSTDFEDLSDIFQGDKNSDLIQSFIPQQGEVKPAKKDSPTAENFFGNRLRRMSHIFTAREDD